MTPLFLIGVPVNMDRLIRWAGDRGWLRHRGDVVGFDEGRALHHLVDETLGPGALRPFRLFTSQGKATGTLYGYCSIGDHTLKTQARIHALPEYLGILALDRMEGKAMPTAWAAGSRLGFDVRVRPVRRLNQDIKNGNKLFRRGVELDAFLLESLRRRVDAGARAGVYLDWLAGKTGPGCGARPRSDAYRALRARVRLARGGRNHGTGRNLSWRAGAEEPGALFGVAGTRDRAPPCVRLWYASVASSGARWKSCAEIDPRQVVGTAGRQRLPRMRGDGPVRGMC